MTNADQIGVPRRGRLQPRWIEWYDRIVIDHAKTVVFTLLAATAFFGYWIKDFRVDASADSLILEHDEDLRFARAVDERYGSGEFLLLTYTPHRDLFADETLADLRDLRDELRALDRVSSVVTILDVPLLQNPPVPIKELRSNIKTLESPDVDKALAREELRTSPLFRDTLVSADMRTTALQINLTPDERYGELLAHRIALRERDHDGLLATWEHRELERVTAQYRQRKNFVARQRHDDIRTVRKIMDAHRASAGLFLGGVSMIADDMISFIRRDLKVFGTGMLAFLVVTLVVIFRRARWVVLPVLCCAMSTVAMMGVLGLSGWDVTVISSNFISLQLIITMALAIHLIVRYREVQAAQPLAEHRWLVRETVRTIFKPCLYTALTTIAGFCSLMVCDILPVINFGWMMTMGLLVSLFVTFLFFPASLVLMHTPTPPRRETRRFAVTALFARFTSRHPGIIFGGAFVIVVLTTVGISRLEVENSFINYFKNTTEIYRGMSFIDRELGGTTPLDIIIDFAAVPPSLSEGATAAGSNEFDEFGEFEDVKDGGKYWFTPERMAEIGAVHDYLDGLPDIGKVLSIQTLLAIASQLTGTSQWDSFELALLFNSFPEEFRKMLMDPYVSVEHNQARVTARIKDSAETLRRDALLRQIARDLEHGGVLKQGKVRLAGVMVLYNNMLQSLFKSQIQTIGFTVLAIMIMFMVLFRSLRISLIAIFPNLVSSLVVLGVMGLRGIPLDMMTITIVAISFGIAVDNTIHYIHRFRREFAADHNYMQTMFRCHGSIGNAMYYTSITIIVGFSILALSDFVPSILFGLLTGLAMAMAMLAALTLLPRMILLFKPFGPESGQVKGVQKRGRP